MDIYAQIAVKIIKGQEAIIGPIALEQAKRVPDLTLDWEKQEAHIAGNEVNVIENLVEVYKQLFGQISVEVSKEAAAALVGRLPAAGLPEVLR